MRIRNFSLIPATIAVAAVLGLTACNRNNPEQTGAQDTGRAAESTTATVQQQPATENANAQGTQGTSAIGARIDDATITASVNARLVSDSSLSALKIDVDTSDGRVALKGTAPDASSKENATRVAQAVDGVLSVDNQLTISN